MFVYGVLSLPLLTPSKYDDGLWLYGILKAVMISVEDLVVITVILGFFRSWQYH